MNAILLNIPTMRSGTISFIPKATNTMPAAK
jgi:hypothetical protein